MSATTSPDALGDGSVHDDPRDEPMLEVDSLWKVFGPGSPDRAIEMARAGAGRAAILAATGQTVAIRDVSFAVARGETFVVMGLSGSGKSTLVRNVARLVDPTRGGVRIEGRDVLAMSAAELRELRRSTMAMVFQHFGLFPHRRVIDNVAYGLEVQGIGRSERHRRASEVIEIVGLEGWAQHYPQELSGGMQQRVGLARALALDPALLFFDEPFSALDPLIRREMQNELLRLQETLQRTIVFITHDFDEALRLGDRIAIMKDGVFDQIGTPEELVANPATEYVREFTNDVPKAKVLTAGTVMRPDAATPTSRSVPAATMVEDVVVLLLESPEPIGVTDLSGSRVGLLAASDVIGLLGHDR